MELMHNDVNYAELDWFKSTIVPVVPGPKPRKRLNIKCKMKTDPDTMDEFRYREKMTKDGMKKSWIYHTIIPKSDTRHVLYRQQHTSIDAAEAYCPNCLADLSNLLINHAPQGENNWTWHELTATICPVCGQALSTHINVGYSQEPYVTVGVSVFGHKIQIWDRSTSIRMPNNGNGLITDKCVKIITVNTKTRSTYLTILRNKKKEIHKVLTPVLSALKYETSHYDDLQQVVIEQFKQMTGMKINSLDDIALVNATRENLTWFNGKSLLREMVFKEIRKEIDRSIWRFDQSKQKLAKALYPYAKANITLLTYSCLSPDNQRKLFEACLNRSMLVRTYRWLDDNDYGAGAMEENEEMRERLYLYALYMVRFIHKDETTSVNRVIKWVNTNTDPDRLLMWFGDTIMAFGEIKAKGGDIRECIKKTLKETHDAAAVLNRKIREPNKKIDYTLKEANYEKTIRGIEFRLPKDTHELISVGEHMNICVGSYGRSAVAKACTIVVGYLNDREEVCIELNDGAIRQAKTFSNQYPTGNTRSAILQWAASCELKLDTYDISRVIEDPLTGEITYDNYDF